MKISGFRSMFHIYLTFLPALLGSLLVSAWLLFSLILVKRSDGSIIKSDWAQSFTADFQEQILFVNEKPSVTAGGIALLQENQIGIQILDSSGRELYHYQEPEQVKNIYSNIELIELSKNTYDAINGSTAFIGNTTYEGKSYLYILFFPMEIKRITMYFNGERFTAGKTVIIVSVGVLLLILFVSGIIYGIWNNASNQLKEQTEQMRREWIANITHDLKAPLAPIKGYAELLSENPVQSLEQTQKYAGIMLKNALYMELLLDDLKLTYQLESGVLPLQLQHVPLDRFLKELIIDILNCPEYENRQIHFESTDDTLLFSFDQKLFTRAFQNLILNAFIHGNEDTEVFLKIISLENGISIQVKDNGNGMSSIEADHLFERHYQGTQSKLQAAGTGLGLSIVKSIIELHSGTISVQSTPKVGTTFYIFFPIHKVN